LIAIIASATSSQVCGSVADEVVVVGAREVVVGVVVVVVGVALLHDAATIARIATGVR
jgi:hypothetical protein